MADMWQIHSTWCSKMLQGRAGRRCFLSIGIQDYAFRPLKHAEKDAEILAFKFQTRGLAENSWESFETLQLFGIHYWYPLTTVIYGSRLYYESVLWVCESWLSFPALQHGKPVMWTIFCAFWRCRVRQLSHEDGMQFAEPRCAWPTDSGLW